MTFTYEYAFVPQLDSPPSSMAWQAMVCRPYKQEIIIIKIIQQE